MSNGANTRAGWFAVSPAILWTVLFFILPFIGMVLTSLWPKGADAWSFAEYRHFFENDAYWRAMTNSLEVTGMVTFFSVLLAYPFAWILAFVIPLRWQRLALMLAVLPFWTSYVVRSYSWLLVLSEKGVVNTALVNIGVLSQPMQLANTRFATVTGFVHFFVMLLTLTIFANLKQLSPNYRKAAIDLGANVFQTFIHVILPLTLPGIMVGAFLTFVLTIGDYITPQILGGNNELLMPQLIMMQIGRRGDFASASALSIILMVIVTAAYLACARWLKIERA
jgi:spermidine/putrescine transport system permease protein